MSTQVQSNDDFIQSELQRKVREQIRNIINDLKSELISKQNAAERLDVVSGCCLGLVDNATLQVISMASEWIMRQVDKSNNLCGFENPEKGQVVLISHKPQENSFKLVQFHITGPANNKLMQFTDDGENIDYVVANNKKLGIVSKLREMGFRRIK